MPSDCVLGEGGLAFAEWQRPPNELTCFHLSLQRSPKQLGRPRVFGLQLASFFDRCWPDIEAQSGATRSRELRRRFFAQTMQLGLDVGSVTVVHSSYQRHKRVPIAGKDSPTAYSVLREPEKRRAKVTGDQSSELIRALMRISKVFQPL